MNLAKLIKTKKANVAVIGLGYVGMPLVLALLRKGFRVFGIDIDKNKIRQVKKLKSYLADIDFKELGQFLKKKRFVPESNFNLIKKSDVAVICVPTPLGKQKQPDISAIENAAKKISQNLKRGVLVILESTSYPGTTRDLIKFFEPKFKLGKDFYLGFSPERIDPGNKTWQLENTPKVVSGIDKKSLELVKNFYSQIVGAIHPVSSLETAEMAKLLENIFRLVNISSVNELTLLADKMGINIWEVIEAAKTKPYGFMPFYPSPGAGGHCIPLDPFYLSWKAKEYDFYPRFIELAGEINDLMPHFAVTKITYALNQAQKALKNSKILVIGVTYKKDIADTRESPVLKIIGSLIHKGAKVDFYDPYINEIKVADPYSKNHTGKHELKNIALNIKSIKTYDCLVIAVNHSNIDYKLITKNAKLIIDLRNAIKTKIKGKIFKL